MANYIDSNILSQAYLHIEPTGLETDEQLENFKNHIEEFAKSRSGFYLYPEVSLQIEFEEGSLKARITLLGTVLLLLEGVSKYPDFREGVRLIYNDSKRLAEYIVSEAQYSANSKHQNVIRVEARTKVIGSLHKINMQLDQVKRGASGTALAQELTNKIEKIKTEVEELMDNIKNSEDKELIVAGLGGLAKEIPENPKPPKNKTNNPNAVERFRKKRRNLLKTFGIA